jgi:hypothetical protein
MTFVLGDSLVYLIEQGNVTLACSTEIFYNHMTHTTTTKNVADVIDINFSKKSDVKFLLATDGAWKKFYSGGGGLLSREMLQAVEEDNVGGYLAGQRCEDDCSVAIIEIPKGA